MTEEQKDTITAMRHDQFSYAAIADRLSLSVNAVKAFCRRNALDSRQLTNGKRISDLPETMPSDGLILSRNRAYQMADGISRDTVIISMCSYNSCLPSGSK